MYVLCVYLFYQNQNMNTFIIVINALVLLLSTTYIKKKSKETDFLSIHTDNRKHKNANIPYCSIHRSN